jgi:hypothetical protein
MSFYKELSPFIDYIHSIRKLESYLSFDMKFPEKWSMPKNIIDEGQVVGFDCEEPNKRGISFVTEVNEKQMSKTLVLVGKIIKLNKERELKEQLFKQTVDQLKKTFEKNDLDKLQNLYFDFESDDINTELDTEIELTDEQDGQEPTDTELVQ